MTLHRKLAKNNKGRDFVVADLHGMYEQLLDGLTKVEFNPDQDRLISVGDLIDRGPDSMKCMNLLDEPWFYAVQGNHERFMIDSLLHNLEAPYSSWLVNGGAWSLEENDSELKQWAERLDALPVTISIEQDDGLPIGIIHAEYPFDDWSDRLDYQSVQDPQLSSLFWSRSQIKTNSVKHVSGVSVIYSGHTPIDKITTLGNCIFIDLGCYSTNVLAFIDLTKR